MMGKSGDQPDLFELPSREIMLQNSGVPRISF